MCRACVILSGGLDSSIAACAGREILGLTAAFTVLCSSAATDRQHAAQVAAALPGLEHHVIDISLEEALEELPDCVRVLQSFDPMMLRNDIAGGWAGSGAAMSAGVWSPPCCCACLGKKDVCDVAVPARHCSGSRACHQPSIPRHQDLPPSSLLCPMQCAAPCVRRRPAASPAQ